jgi:AcrR family transcriptional regulator
MEETDIKDKILNGAMELFMKYGVRSVSMDDIARHLSVSKKTIYQYFTDKDDVVTRVAHHHLDTTKGEFDSFRADSKNAIDELVKISQCLKKDMQEMNASLLFDLHKYHPKAWNVWLEYKNKHIRASIIDNMVQGIEEGYFRPEINPDILSAVRLEQVQLAFDDHVFPHDRFNLSEVQIQIFEHFIYGLLTDKGRKLYEKYKLELKEPEPQHLAKL